MKTRSIMLAALQGAVLLLGLSAPTAWAGHVACGDVIVADTVLDSNLGPCAGDGVVIGAGGVTLDLNGFTIEGTGGGAGVRIGNVNDVTVRNGTIKKFFRGIDATTNTGTSDSTIEELKLQDNSEDGAKVKGNGNELLDNKAEKNGRHGINVDGNDNELIDNQANKNAQNGIKVRGTGNLLEDNRAKKNGNKGITADGGGNIDGGGNKGKANGGTDCVIDGVACL